MAASAPCLTYPATSLQLCQLGWIVLLHNSLISERLEWISKENPSFLICSDSSQGLFLIKQRVPGSNFLKRCLLPLPPRQEVDLRARGQRCTSWWRGSGRHLRSTDRPAPSAVKATSMCKKNVRSFSCRRLFPEAGTWTVCHLLGSYRTTSLRVKLGQTLLYICQRAEDPAHGDLWPQIWWEAGKWPQNTSNSWLFSPLQNIHQYKCNKLLLRFIFFRVRKSPSHWSPASAKPLICWTEGSA